MNVAEPRARRTVINVLPPIMMQRNIQASAIAFEIRRVGRVTDEHGFLVRPALVARKMTPRNGNAVRAVNDVALTVINFSKVAMIHPDVMAVSLPGVGDAIVIPTELVIFAGRVELPQIAETQIAKNDVRRAVNFNRAPTDGRAVASGTPGAVQRP